MRGTNFIQKIDTKNISDSTLLEMAKVQKDMWAYWLGEYVRCNCCNEIYSKNDIFWHLSSEIKTQSVTKLEEIFLWDSIKCKNCDSVNTEFIHNIDKSISLFREIFKKESFLILSYDNKWDIIWFCDWFIASFDFIYDIELKSHYWNVSSNVIWNIVKTKLDIFDLSSMLNVPSIWTYEKNINYNLIYDLIRFFYKSINTEKIIPCIIELDKNNSLYKIYKMMWSLSLWLDNNFVNNTNKKYNSDICVFPNPVNDFKSKFDLPFRELIKKHKLK